MSTKIEWTNETWNPIAGCDPVSPGCQNCYAAIMAHRLAAMGQEKYVGTTARHNGHTRFNGTIKTDPGALTIPRNKKQPRMWFVNSMSDLFHDNVPGDFRRRVFDEMSYCDWHTFQVLTKRPEKAVEVAGGFKWTSNIWMGTSIENAAYAHRSTTLSKIPAAVRFLSVEPTLGPIPHLPLQGIHWVIVGCESGPGKRPFDNAWALDVIQQCRSQGVKVFIKQIIMNGKVSKAIEEWPAPLRIREYPV